jgi:Mg2+-importing ATPase
MIVISCTVRFWQEYRGNVEAVKLQNSTSTTVQVRRPESALKVDQHLETAVDERDLVPGDVIHINPGDSVPADCLVIEASHLQISQSSLTGESEPLRKTPSLIPEKISPGLFERENLLFMGTSVISGSGLAVVLTTGDGAFIATIMKELNKKRPVNAFQRGVRHVSYLMITFMLIMVPIVSC